MLSILLSQKWKTFFSFRQNASGLIAQFLLFTFLGLYAFAGGALYDMSVHHKIGLSSKTITTCINSGLLLIPVIIKFFPSISLKPVIIQRHYPLVKVKAAAIELLFYVFSGTWIYFLVMACTIYYLSSSYITLNESLTTFSYGICGILFAENLINGYYTKKRGYMAVMIAILLSTLILTQKAYLVNYAEIIPCGLVSLLVFSYYFFYEPNSLFISSKGYGLFSSSKNVLLKMTLRNEKYKAAALFSLCVQLTFSFVFLQFLANDLLILKFYFLSSLMLFSYCYNNLWGFFSTTAFAMYLAGNKTTKFIILFIQILLPILIINTIGIAILLCFHPNLFSTRLLIGFSALTLFIIVNGLLFSFIKMKNVTKAISFDKNNFNTNLIPAYFFSFISIGLCVVVTNDLLFPLYIICLVIYSISGIVLMYLKQEYFLSMLIKRLVKK